MTPDSTRPPSRRPGATLSHTLTVDTLAAPATSWVRNWASQDWIAVGYFVVLLSALAMCHGPGRNACIVRVAANFGLFLFVLALVRGNVLRWGSALSAQLYRVAIIATLLNTFFQLREILPLVSPWTDDARIYAFDMKVFGFEPSVWLDRYVTPATTEWFAFFYFLYFLILCVHVLPMVFASRDTHLLNQFATGALLLFLSSHIIYMMVPGYGPYWYLKDAFTHPLTGGTFWRWVNETVDAGGAQKDIFPSLHTGSPTFFAIFSFRHRKLSPFKYTWPVITFLGTQIVIATMFLRWHYLIDIFAGVALAATCQFLGQRVADWERAKRERLGLQTAWMPLVYPWSKPSED
ncbi:MAG TPA: phosphatase PAP2 family protein [Polyangiaceae bacterium]|jgi:hypothetical protein